MSHTRHFVLKICETIRTGIRSNYSNTRILFGVPKNPNTEYRILFGIEKIRIPNINTTIRSNYSNSIRIPNYSFHRTPMMMMMRMPKKLTMTNTTTTKTSTTKTTIMSKTKQKYGFIKNLKLKWIVAIIHTLLEVHDPPYLVF